MGNSEKNKYYDKLVLRKLMGITSPEEDTAFELWLNADRRNRESYEALRAKWRSHSDDPPEFAELRRKSSKRKTTSAVEEPPKPRSWSFYVFEGVALALLVTATVLIFMGLKERPSIVHAGSKIKTVMLPDSSEVTMKPGSVLLISSSFGPDNRSVQVEGQAFMQIKPDSLTPFVVVTDHTRLAVTGTSFMVNIEDGGVRDEVAVVEGEVRMSSRQNPEKEIVITAGKKAQFNYRAGALTLSEADTLNMLAWKDRKLVFDNTPLSEVFRVVEDYFDIPVQVENREILNCTFTRSFSEPSLDDVIKSLREKMDVIIMREYGRVVVDGRNTCPESE